MARRTRQDVTHLVYDKLADPAFRRLLTAKDDDGNAPILVSLPSDRVRRMLSDIIAVGGRANVAIPFRNGIVVLSVASERRQARRRRSGPQLDINCTVGVLLEQVSLDGGAAVYSFAIPIASNQQDLGRAELVAIAG